MAGPHDGDRTLTHYYDESLDDGRPYVPPQAGSWGTRPYDWRWPRRRRVSGRSGQRRFKLTWPYPGRRLGDALVFLTSADGKLIGSKHERHRYATVGLLMVVTTAQAFYAATLFFSVGLGKPFRSVIYFGAFFAVAVLLIDRSIISYAAPVRLDKDKRLRPPKKTNGVLFIRVGIAIVAAILMSEMILLQVFAGDISEQIQNNHLAVTKSTNAQIEANYEGRISKLRTQINEAQATVNSDQTAVNNAQAAVNKATHDANCQEFGCPGITAGRSTGFFAAEKTLQGAQKTLGIDQQKLSAAQTRLANVSTSNLNEISLLNTQEQAAINAAQPAITNADKLLSQEEAFWQLTVKNGNVLVVRLLLSLLILGIDLAPILTKLTGRTTVHDIRAHEGDHLLAEEHRLRLEEHRNKADVSVYQYAKQADNDRKLHDLAMGTMLFEAQQDADVRRNRRRRAAEGARAQHDADLNVRLYQIRHDANLRKLRHYRRHAEEWRYLNDGRTAGRTPRNRQAGSDDDVAVSFRHDAPPAREAEGGHVDDAGPPRNSYPPGDDSPYSAEEEVPFPPEPGEVIDVPGVPPAPDDYNPPRETRNTWEMAGILWGQDEPPGLLVLANRYALYERLPGADAGGGGIVWLAKDRQDPGREWIVVKTVPSGSLNTETSDTIKWLGQRGLHNEQRVARVVDNHIGQILARGDDRGFSYLVYPLYRPGSLAMYCRQDGVRVTLPWCAQIIGEVLSGLMTASARNLVHLDLKPGNIVLDGEHARIIDWGLSRKWDAAIPSTWVVRGTPFFACPEQLIKPQVGWDTPRADLYGVGATFYWLITDKAPFQREVEAEDDGFSLETYRRLLIRGVRVRRVDELVPGVPEALGRLIDRWMSFDPASRVPPGTPSAEAARAARDELRALGALPNIIVGHGRGRSA